MWSRASISSIGSIGSPYTTSTWAHCLQRFRYCCSLSSRHGHVPLTCRCIATHLYWVVSMHVYHAITLQQTSSLIKLM
jgi:hypothetical protein